MSKLLSVLILFAPFFIVTFYWVIDKYIHFLFGVGNGYETGLISTMLTAIGILGIMTVIVEKVEK